MTENDATVVARIPLSRSSVSNKLIWRNSITREFSVKSAYYVARRILGREEFVRAQSDKVWRWIWTAQVALKLKFFMWQMVQGILPTKSRIQEKGIQSDL